jgi:hypothetical protein
MRKQQNNKKKYNRQQHRRMEGRMKAARRLLVGMCERPEATTESKRLAKVVEGDGAAWTQGYIAQSSVGNRHA